MVGTYEGGLVARTTSEPLSQLGGSLHDLIQSLVIFEYLVFTGQFDVISGVTYEKSVKSCFQLLNFYETSQNSTSKFNTKNGKKGFIGKSLAAHRTPSGSLK